MYAKTNVHYFIFMQVIANLHWTMTDIIKSMMTMKMKLTMKPMRTKNMVQSVMKMMLALILPLQVLPVMKKQILMTITRFLMYCKLFTLCHY